MTNKPTYCLSARLSADYSFATIDRADGESVTVPSAHLGALFLDLSVDDGGYVGTAEHHRSVLDVWFENGGRPVMRRAA